MISSAFILSTMCPSRSQPNKLTYGLPGRLLTASSFVARLSPPLLFLCTSFFILKSSPFPTEMTAPPAGLHGDAASMPIPSFSYEAVSASFRDSHLNFPDSNDMVASPSSKVLVFRVVALLQKNSTPVHPRPHIKGFWGMMLLTSSLRHTEARNRRPVVFLVNKVTRHAHGRLIDFALCGVEDEKEQREREPEWLPLPLRFWFWFPLVVILVLGAIGLEVALHFSKRNQGELSAA